MKILILIFALCCAINIEYGEGYKKNVGSEDSEVICGYDEVDSLEFRKVLYDFSIKSFKSVALHSGAHFVYSPFSIWQSMAAIAEGTRGLARQELDQLLGLPEDGCLRQMFYKVASSREPVGPDVSLDRKRLFIVDEGVTVNDQWKKFAQTHCYLVTAPAPIRRDPQKAAFSIRHSISAQLSSLNLQGNSVVADSLDYHGLWSEAFPQATITRSPFYNHKGDKIGSVDMMRMKKRVRMAFIQQLNTKVVEIPVGHNGRYRMWFGIPVGGQEVRSAVETMTSAVIFETIDNLKESFIPLEVAIPRFLMSSEIDVKSVLEDMGVHSLWSNALATGNISEPSALPSSYIQRVQITLDSHGVESPTPDFAETTSSDTGLDPILGKEVIIDRPFMFGLFDVETYTCLFAAAFSVPSYK